MITGHPLTRSKMPYQNRNKSVSPTCTKALLLEREHRHHYLIRSLPLLILMFYAVVCTLKFAPPSSSSVHPTDSSFAETGKDMESLKTHISSNGQRLQAYEEKRCATSVPCSALIDGGRLERERERERKRGVYPIKYNLNHIILDSPYTVLTTTGGIDGRSCRIDEGLLCCDRSHYRTDVCYMRGDIRTNPGSSSILLNNAGMGMGMGMAAETIRPYTRKWETAVMNTIDEITLQPGNKSRRCDVHHKGVPAIVFSAGGYTGNVYHEFNDGLIPLYITAQRFEGEVVLVVLEYQSWWFSKYRSVLKRLTNYRLVDLAVDRRVHCFGEMIVGLKIHGEQTIDPQLMPDGKGIRDFQALLGQGFGGPQPPSRLRPSVHTHISAGDGDSTGPKPKIAIFVRHKSRVLSNLKEMIRACHRMGFRVQTIDPRRSTPLAEIYNALNSSDVMLAVHGAAMTHFLFMRPASVLIQIVPLGLDWPAETYYGEPARKLGLEYMPYKVAPAESSLSRLYDRDDPVIADPSAITSKGWWETKKVYLDNQNIKVNLTRFTKLLNKAHSHAHAHAHAHAPTRRASE